MVCTVEIYEKPKLNNPVLIEGLPGIGFVANIATLHLIHELKAKLFAEMHSSAFQDFAITADQGKTRHPVNEFYYYKGRGDERDLILLYGNTQALTTMGQYELCGRTLDVAEELGCNYIITLGGLRRDEKITTPKLYCAASDKEALKDALDMDASILGGQIFGVAGLLVALGKLRGFKGFCLLAETPGFYPDVQAAHVALKPICNMLRLDVSLDRLEAAAEETRKILESFGLLETPLEERRKEESEYRWFV
ncbi:MAG: proteasome assembly chaperone family protein [Candidatus Bathyarchaeia archaeon]